MVKKIGGQTELVEGNLPELQDEDVAQKLEQIWQLRDNAKTHDRLLKEAKETIQGWVLGLNKKDQGIGHLRCGDFVLPFSIETKEPTPVSYETTGGKKVKVKFAPEHEDEKK